jgi:hypothetical protein
MLASLWLVVHFLRSDSSSKAQPVYVQIWSSEGLPIDPLITQAVRSI